MPHGLSLSDMLTPGKPLPWVCGVVEMRVTVDGEVEGRASVDVDGPDDRDGLREGLKPANVPSRCISLVTSFASYVRAEGCYGISNGKPTSVVSVVEINTP